MKTKLMLVTGLMALAFCLPTALAEDGDKEKKKKRPKGPPSKERILKKFDKNEDGALSKEELAEMPEKMSTRLLEKWDKDEDGALSKEEVDAIKFPERKPGDRPPKKKGDKKKGGDKEKDAAE